MNYDTDLDELDKIWPLGKQLIVPEGGSVLVAGAYEGRYMDYICTRFKPERVLGFEPQAEKKAIAEERLIRHGDLTRVYGVGIGVHDCIAFASDYGTDGCKVSRAMADSKEIKLRGVDSILDDHGPFDLFICNMEGYEEPLMAYMLATGRIEEIRSLAIQFHSPTQLPRKLLLKLLDDIDQHYDGSPVYNDYPTWSYWRRK